MKRILYVPDAWWPVLSANGRDLVAGNTSLKAWHLPAVTNERAAPQWNIGAGRNGHFIRPSIITFTRERTQLTADRYEYDLRTGQAVLQLEDPALVAGNEFDARDGHWASWLATGGRIVYDGRVIAFEARGAKVAGDLLLYTLDGMQQLVVRNMRTQADTRYPLPPTANLVSLTPDGYIGYGYYWPPHVIAPAPMQGVPYEDVNLTVTPWKAESVPTLCRALRDGMNVMWAWTFSQRPGDGKGLVLGRPMSDAVSGQAIIIEDFVADAQLSVAYRRDIDSWIVAGNASEGGVMSVWQVPYETPRVMVQNVGVEEPPPEEEMPLKKPEITVDEYGKELTPTSVWKARFRDRENGTVVEVRIENGKLWMEMSNTVGVGRTGAVRLVNIHD